VQPTPTRLTLGTLLERVETGAFTVTRSTYAPRQRLSSHAHELASATIVLRGGVTERVGQQRFECGLDRLLVRPASVVHSNAYWESGAECVIIGARPEWIATDTIARAVFGAPVLSSTPASRAVGQRIRRELGIGDTASTLAIEGLAFELVAAAARALRDPSERTAPRWLRTVRERLHDDFASMIRLHVIARAAGVHPVHLTRAFRRCFGCSPGEYVRERRIDHACRLLAESDRPITTVALEAGFSSPSHFATAFRRVTGSSPREYRVAAQANSARGFKT
jgi:AraC family transcriptional regulator